MSRSNKHLFLDSCFDLNLRQLDCLNKSNSSSQLIPNSMEMIRENSFLSKQSSDFSHQSIILSQRNTNKQNSTFREHFVRNITKIKQSTTTLINMLKENQSVNTNKLKLKLDLKKNMTTKNINNNQINILSSIDKIKPLFKRKRLLKLTEEEVLKKSKQIYLTPLFLLNAQNTIKDMNLQLSSISDQLLLISSNVNELKSEILFSSNFLKAFTILNKEQKVKFNYLLEETCSLLLFILPKILSKLYSSLDQILYCAIPNISEEEMKVVQSENDCMLLDLKWFNIVSTYFIDCLEVFQLTKNNVPNMLFLPKDYFHIKIYLDLLRYDSNWLIVIGRHYIEKYYNDEEMINRFEEGVNHIDHNEQYSSHAPIKSQSKSKAKMLKNVNVKLSKMKAVFNNEERSIPLISKDKRFKKKLKYTKLRDSLLNLPVINDIIQYYDKETREKIIAQRVFERLAYRNEEIEEKENNKQ